MEDEKIEICNNCEYAIVIDAETDGERFMFIYCALTLIFCYSLYLPDSGIVELGYTCGGKLFKRRPIFELQ